MAKVAGVIQSAIERKSKALLKIRRLAKFCIGIYCKSREHTTCLGTDKAWLLFV